MAVTKSKPTQSGPAYVVVHDMVGPHVQGDVFYFTEQDLADGHDPDRLLALGAVREATKKDGDPVRFRQGTNPAPGFPPVPFQPATVSAPLDGQEELSEPVGKPPKDLNAP